MSRTSVAIIALSCVASGQSAWRLPATIEVLKDVALEVPAGRGERRGALSIHRSDALMEFGSDEPGIKHLIKKGQRFLMTAIHPEGGCTIKVGQREFFIGSCHWLEGFTDHQDDFYKVVSGRGAK